MSIKTARCAIDFVVGNAKDAGADHVELGLHGGGEPTLNWAVLTGAVGYARTQADVAGIRVDAALATNGVLPDIKTDWITRNLASASISFDGLPDVHDRHRPQAGGGPSSHRVLHTLERFDATGFPYGVRVTVTAEHIARLPEAVDFLYVHCSPRRVQVEPAYRLGRWSTAPTAETEAFVEAYAQQHGPPRTAASSPTPRHGRAC